MLRIFWHLQSEFFHIFKNYLIYLFIYFPSGPSGKEPIEWKLIQQQRWLFKKPPDGREFKIRTLLSHQCDSEVLL